MGKVVALEQNFIVVKIQKQSSCGNCSAQSSCGVSVLSKVFGNRSSVIRLKNIINAHKGDEVAIIISSADLIRASFLSYIMPLLGFIFFLLVGDLVQNQWPFVAEWFVVLLAFCGIILAGVFSRWWFDHRRDNILSLRNC